MRYNITSPTTCATMHREEKNGTTTATLNGTAETATVKDEYIAHPRQERTNYNQGGRLKFFKDGKFILELERAREGERVSWVSVPRKTFWPPQSTPTSTPTYRQESSTSLSVSDDNSSIQSSPWQRDHSWKQTTPQRNLSKPLCFYYRRPRNKTSNSSSGSQFPVLNSNSHRKCHYRRPYHDINVKQENPDASPSPPNLKTGDMTDGKLNVKCEPRCRGKFRSMGLLAIVQSLVERIGVNVNVSGALMNGTTSLGAIRTPPRQDVIVSPRKRFLREMDRDNKVVTEDNCQKRSRSKQTSTLITPNNNSISAASSSSTSTITTNTSTPPSNSITSASTSSTTTPHSSVTASIPSQVTSPPLVTTTTATSTTTSHAPLVTTRPSSSSYSITSLLADDRPSSGGNSGMGGGGGNRSGRKASPLATVTTPSHGYLGFGGGGPGHNPPSVEERLYTENVDRLRSIELSHADKRAAAAAAVASALAYNPLHSALPSPGPIPPPLPPSPYAGYLPYHHHHPALYHPHHYAATPSAPSPLYYAALYSHGGRPAPYNQPYSLPTIHPPPVVAVTTTGVSRLLSGLHHHSSSGSSVWTTPRQTGAPMLPSQQSVAMAHPAVVDLSRLHPATLANASGSGSPNAGSVVHNDALSDMPLNLSKNAG